MNILQLAGSLPRDPQFREWLQSRFSPEDEWTEAMAATFIRAQCGVESRKELLDDRRGSDRFHRFIRLPFLAWRDQQQTQRRAA